MSVDVQGLSIGARKQLVYAVRLVLRPIVRLMLRVGISFDEFADVARGAYVDSAIRDRSRHGPLTRERVAFITGMSREQIDHYIDNEHPRPGVGLSLARVASEVLHRWHTDPLYLGPFNIPLELEFDLPQDRCFQSLVQQVNPRASPGRVLEELLRAGAVAYFGEKHFRAIARWFIFPGYLSPYQIENFGEALEHLAQTLEYNGNLADSENKRLERSVFADKGIPRELLPSFEDYARTRALKFLEEIDDWLARSTVDSSESSRRVNTGVNIFLYVEPLPDQQELSVLVQPRRDIGTRAVSPPAR